MAHWFHRNPLKATVNVRFAIKVFSNDGQALKICSELTQARNSLLELLCDPNHTVTAVETALNNYLALLQGLFIAADERGGESKLRYALRFRWTNSLLGNTPSSQQDVVFELVSVCQNTAIWLMKHAAVNAGKDEVAMEEAKEIHKCLRKAAGIFHSIQEQYVTQLLEKPEPGSDLDSHVITCYINQCTAEAQEVTIARAIELKHSPSLISALSNETYKMYNAAADTISSLDPSKFGKWKKYFQLKSLFYLAYAYCYAGENLLAQEKCGEAIRALQESDKYYTLTGKLCKDYAHTKGPGTSAKPEQHLFFRKLGPVVKRTLDKCERENGFIFHQRVPYDPPELELKATYGLVSPEEFKLPTISPLWTPVTYAAFDVSQINPLDPANSNAAAKAEGEIPPVQEVNVQPTSKDPKNTSGCNIQ
ncbi:BRO1 domain-containing protein BROX-like [Limulus polyphemus]|uniref:BRO1 domain-containing protein BROX-like n=1 Tax=Limulus polyphemus TaxID=6850 RepID=A0ABM1BFZ0_LIMPO|nr:BRO1 domain-containing protein BROX-like [Limulus polyphemus]